MDGILLQAEADASSHVQHPALNLQNHVRSHAHLKNQ